MSLVKESGLMSPFLFPYSTDFLTYDYNDEGCSNEPSYENQLFLDPLFNCYPNLQIKPQLLQNTIQISSDICKVPSFPSMQLGTTKNNITSNDPKKEMKNKKECKKKKDVEGESSQLKKRGRPYKIMKIPSTNVSNQVHPFSLEQKDKKRGRPKITQHGDDINQNVRKKKKKMKKEHSPQLYKRVTANSVRSIPCFYFNCTYSYKRPGSTIIEISDRPLLLSSKFDGYVIRSCKKHHDKWKSMEKLGIRSCEICCGINLEESERSHVQVYTNDKKIDFILCRPCAERQSLTLRLSIELTLKQIPNLMMQLILN